VAFRRRATETEVLAAHARALADERDRRERAAAEAERSRIARELHDVVGHGLSLIVLQLVAAQEVLDAGNVPALQARLIRAESSARDALAEMRRLLDLLDEGETAALTPQPGLGELDRLVTETRSAGADVELRISGTRPELPPGLDLAAFRILQESLTNVLKHARPPAAEVCLTYCPDRIELEVRDHGLATTEGSPPGRGLAGMRARAGLYGGELTAGPSPDGGYRVRARLPVPR
jgi:signal transduction histidine kinase